MENLQEHELLEDRVDEIGSSMAALSIDYPDESEPAPNLTTIPLEVRLRILRKVVTFPCALRFVTRRAAREAKFRALRRRANVAILLCNRQLHDEAEPEWYKQNTITLHPPDRWNTLPPHAYTMIHRLQIKIDAYELSCYHSGSKTGYAQLEYFQNLKTLTLKFGEDAAASVDDVLWPEPAEGMRGMYKTSATEVVIKGIYDQELVDRIEELLLDRPRGRNLVGDMTRRPL